MMRYKTRQIGEDGLDIDLAVTGPWLARECAEAGVEPTDEGLKFTGRLERTGGGADEEFLLRGQLRGAVTMPCARCLEPTRVPLNVPVVVSFVEKLPEKAEGGFVEIESDAGDFVVIEDGEIDLAHELREEILLALPMSPRCEPECLGMCPSCGANRDKDPCDCAERAKVAASPFAMLAKLKS